MNIKPLIISLVALGFVSGAVFAADKTVAVTKTVKKKAVKVAAVNKDTVAPMLTAADTKAQQTVIDENALVNPTDSFNWFNRIQVGGLANADLLWGNHEPAGSYANTGDYFDIFIPNANLLFDAKINDYTAAHVNLVYKGYPAHYRGYLISGGNTVNVDDAYVTISDLANTPFYARVGVQYLPFGDYERYPLVGTFAQGMDEASEAAITLGMAMDNGFYASVYAFNGPTKESKENKYSIRNGGAKVGYYGTLDSLYDGTKYNVNVSWMRNIYDNDHLYAAFVTGVSNSLLGTTTKITGGASATNRVGGFGAHADMTVKDFDFAGNFVTALNGMVQNISDYSSIISSYTTNSRLWAADVDAGYSFKTMDRDSRVGLIYQWTGHGEFTADLFQPASLDIPHYAIDATYTVNLMKNVDLGVAAQHSWSYDYRSTYSGIHGSDISGKRGSDLIVTRLSVKF